MKRLLFVCMCLVICQMALAQGKGKGKKKNWIDESAVPSVVVDAFKAKFADASNSKWKQTKKGNFKAAYKNGEDKVEAIFSPDGTWKHTRTNLADANIPATITSHVSSNYSGYELKKVVLHDNAGKGKQYLAHLKKDEEKKKLVFNADGSFKKEAEKKRKKGKGNMSDDDDDSDN